MCKITKFEMSKLFDRSVDEKFLTYLIESADKLLEILGVSIQFLAARSHIE